MGRRFAPGAGKMPAVPGSAYTVDPRGPALNSCAQHPVGGLRISVTGGGCSGMQYGMALEPAAKSNDVVVEVDDIKVFVDPLSAGLLAGVTVDFLDGMEGSGFKFENPNATNSCGCGKSFSA
ncbi:MAG: iron-sulfur cluster assembly accessory protein [Pseudomonadota bacterium]|nr:iron-sulfur cluster assembly accessory protein [Pseudomonadota bacterium]